ncbi:hypothetical protein [Methylobacterium sp. R2-1]|uniref:hypothetical protein n=1 Tax=Methylobacterium sp. R2-1 TaxID=2587064 RepID=UPI001617275E|nr:hypothetical protein [Methylobacterium sp. R2-1]MBB2965223.1 hypothetical protein [Methylobacterium sp. R2-1]
MRVDLSAGTVDFRQNEIAMASAATVDLGSSPAGRVVITGSTAILSFGPGKNLTRLVRFANAVTLTHNATSLILPGGANYTTLLGDMMLVTLDSAGNWRVRLGQHADGRALLTVVPVTGNSGPVSVTAGTVRYFTHGLLQTAASLVYVGAGRRGRFRNLRVVSPGVPGTDQFWKFTLQNLFTDTALTCTISGAGSNQAQDLVNSAIFAAADRWSIKVEASAGANPLTSILFSLDFEVLD